jgi:hypothetical protein
MFELIIYNVVDWVGCTDTCRSTSDYMVFLGDNLGALSLKHQNVVSHSSAEVEYHVVAEVRWFRQLFVELHNPCRGPPSLLRQCQCDLPLHQLVQHQCTKHVEIDLNFVRECVIVGDIHVLHILTTSQFIIFTKGMPSSVFSKFRSFPSKKVLIQSQHLHWLEFRLRDREG